MQPKEPRNTKAREAFERYQAVIAEAAHRLVIRSLHDAHAECSCGSWHYTFTGARTRAEIEAEFALHFSLEVIENAALRIKESDVDIDTKKDGWQELGHIRGHIKG